LIPILTWSPEISVTTTSIPPSMTSASPNSVRVPACQPRSFLRLARGKRIGRSASRIV
jgi:hypothetical protein